MALALIGLVIIVGSVLLVSTRRARRERRLPPHVSFLLEDEAVEQDGRFRRLLAWLRSLVTEPEGGYGGWSSGGGFGGFGASAVAEAVEAVEAVGVAAAEGASYAWRALVRTSLMGGAMGKYGTRRRFHPWGCWMALLHAVDFGGGRVLWVNTSHGSAPQADRATQVD